MGEARPCLMTLVVVVATMSTMAARVDKTEALFSLPPAGQACLENLIFYCTTMHDAYTCCLIFQTTYFSQYDCLCTVYHSPDLSRQLGFDLKDYLVQCSVIKADANICGSAPSTPPGNSFTTPPSNPLTAPPPPGNSFTTPPTKPLTTPLVEYSPPTHSGEGWPSNSKLIALVTSIPISVVLKVTAIVFYMRQRRRNNAVHNININNAYNVEIQRDSPELASPNSAEQPLGPSTGPHIFDPVVLQNSTGNF